MAEHEPSVARWPAANAARARRAAWARDRFRGLDRGSSRTNAIPASGRRNGRRVFVTRRRAVTSGRIFPDNFREDEINATVVTLEIRRHTN